MSLETNKELAENKLTLLYIFDKLNISINNAQITRIVLENKFMNYFYLQEYLKELCDSRFLTSSQKEGKTIYEITVAGKQTLTYFQSHIPFSIKMKIDEILAVQKKNIRQETQISAEFIPESEVEFAVNCRVQEDNFSLIDLRVTVGTRNDARIICDNWKKYSEAIYQEILEILTRKRD
jgi:predicted transcriptional regulator